MIDINFLRENTELVKEALKRKKFKVDVDAVLELDEKRRGLITDAESAKAHQNQANKQMSSLDKKSDAFREKIQEMKSLALKTKELEQLAKKSDLAFQLAFIELPNLPDPSIPNGFKESDNLEVNRFGSCEEVNRYAIPHYDIPWFDEGVQFSKGTKVISTWHIGVGYKNEIDIWGEKGSLYSDKIFSKLNNYTPNLWYKDQNGTLEIQELVSTNQFVKMFDNFLLLTSSNEFAEQERKNIIKRAKVMDLIFNY